MKISKLAIKRSVTFFMIYLIALGFGLFSLIRLKVDLYPKLEFPMVAIITQYTGVSPFDIETVITRPIEETVAPVQNVKKVSSTTKQGLSLVLLEFDWGTDMNQAEIDVRNNLEFVRDYLPEDASEPLVFALDPSSQPILFMGVSSDLHGEAELRRISERDIEPRIERIPGVAMAFTTGGMRREIKIQVDPAKLRAHNIPIQQVSAALQSNNLQLPSGWLEDEHREFTIQTVGEYHSIEQIKNTNIATVGNTVIRIKDVANVVDGFADLRQRVWTNGKRSVILMVQKQSDANTVAVSREVTGRFEQIQSELPKGVKLNVIYDQSTFINRSMSNLGSTAVQAIGLAFLVLLVFLRNFRSSLIVAISIPVSIIVTFAVMDQTGLTLNIISMAGLALAVGLLVDNSIVVLESIFRHQEEGENIETAAYNGANEVAMAITASTLTTLSVFVPVLFVPGLAGELFSDMVVTICFSLAVSLFVALTLIPLLASRFLAIKQTLRRSKIVTKTRDSVGRGLSRLQTGYSVVLDRSLQHRKTVLATALVTFVISILILMNLGGEFIPKNDMGFVQIVVDRSPGTSLESMGKSMLQLNKIIEENVPEAEVTYITFGQGEGVFAAFSTSTSNQADVIIRLKKMSERNRTMAEIQDDLREKFKMLPDLKIKFEDRGAAMFGSAGDIVVEIYGHDLKIAEELSKEIRGKIENIKGIVHIESTVKEAAPELRINLNRQRIADLGLSTTQIGRIVSTSVLGTVVTRYRDQGDEYDVRVQLTKKSRNNEQDIGNIPIMTPFGKQIPLRAVANIEYAKAPAQILREDQERMVSLNVSVSGRDLRSVTKDVEKALKGVSIPNEFRIGIGGVAQDQQESFMYLGIALLVAVLLTYMVMASQFESLVDPFIILFTIPLSSIGVALGLALTGTDLSVMALVGIVMLIGIVVNNGIVLVDYINQLRERGLELFDAIRQGGLIRMRPVLMTALTTILAMLPLGLGLGESGENWAPMARSVMGGLTAGTVLTLIVVPVIYAVVEIVGEKTKKRFGKKTDEGRERKLAPEKI
ncbi:MAG TPA: efflux RND transporter permease subunit [Bacteroidetes bacterium]|nr:efflux RND transporter permease subunit [Bacteroidota bacterium]